MLQWKSVSMVNILFFSATMSIAIGQRAKSLAFCKRGFQVSALYSECWEQATSAKPFGQQFEAQDVYDAVFLEKYASHMCSVVKPLAIRCLRKKVKSCSNSQKLVSIAGNSGGTCVWSKLNPFFKLDIIKKLKPVARQSRCFDVSKKSRTCYAAASEKVTDSGPKADSIPQFHKVADKFFDHLWQCMVDIFKSNAEACPNWQLPMLMTLQRSAMPSLFGMRLNNYQIRKLELDSQQADKGGQSDAEDCGDIGCPQSKSGPKLYVLIRVLTEKPKKQEGDVLLELTSTSSSNPKLGVAVDDPDNVDVRDFVAKLMSGEKISQSKNSKEVKDYPTSIQRTRSWRSKIGARRTTDENGMVN